ncbi:hypothetical protein GFV15_00155 [Lactococcus lactis]|uniref:VirB6/TrbL-like conjugal transfer protein, CD1112 family n=1 Tax=Lactococcus lactis TaxID=1358 RepID=UPI0012930BD9|nr:CD0415/CD1112 family protein [Lactococcus lactis]MQQ79406.1 hypothetical protein [Lactococcus lactis]
MIDGIIEAIQKMLTTQFLNGAKFALTQTNSVFGLGVKAVREQVAEGVSTFSPQLLDSLRTISNTAILPVAGLVITYIFCYEIYQFAVEHNKGVEFDISKLLWVIIRTSIMIELVTNSFNLVLAFFDLGTWIANKVPNSVLDMPEGLVDNIISSVKDTDFGQAMMLMLLCFIALIIALVMVGAIFLVAWTRLITIFLYITVAPLPVATLLNKDWIGTIGQSYFKNIIALMLQGFFMLVCLVIYSGILVKASEIISNSGNGLYALVLVLVTMVTLVFSLLKTHSLAKSVVGAM